MTDENGIRARSDIYLIDHALTMPDSDVAQLRTQIASYPQLTDRIGAMFGVDTTDEAQSKQLIHNQILQKFWKFANCYHLSGHNSSSVWFVMDELGSAIAHSGEPNVMCVPFVFIHSPEETTDGSTPQPQLISYSLMWPVSDLEYEAYVERDFCPWITTPIERIAHLADWVSDLDEDLLEQLTKGSTYHSEFLQEMTTKGGIDGHCFTARNLCSVSSDGSSGGSTCNDAFIATRQAPLASLAVTQPLKVYTPPSVDPLRLHDATGGLSHPSFTIVDSRDDADILWLSEPMKATETTEFWQPSSAHPPPIPPPSDMAGGASSADSERKVQWVNQFPYEGVFCLKDNLTREVARCLGMPKWWVPTYDLETQLPIFVGDYLNHQQRQQEKTSTETSDYNVWIAKPNNGTRSAGHVVSHSLVRIIRSLEINKSRIAQKYIERPLLFQGKYKFDMRFVVLVRSFEPGKEEIYVYNDFWCRVANKPHRLETSATNSGDTQDEGGEGTTLNHLLFEDSESYLTATYFLEAEQRAKMPSCDNVIADLLDAYPFLSWEQVYGEICHMLREVFLGLSVGQQGKMHASQARAIYGVDVMLEAVRNPAGEVVEAVPKLLEVSFTPSCSAVNPAFEKLYPSYVNDVFSCLFLAEQSNVTRLL